MADRFQDYSPHTLPVAGVGDDDAEAIDSYFEAPDWIDDAPTSESAALTAFKMRPPHRIISTGFKVSGTSLASSQLMPKDTSRHKLIIQSYQGLPFYVASEPFAIPADETGDGFHMRVNAYRHNGGALDLMDYTGAVHVCGLGAGADVHINALAITDGTSK